MALSSVAAFGPPAATNIATNGGLESGSTGWTTGTGFGNRTIERVEELAKFGTFSMRTTISGALTGTIDLQTLGAASAGVVHADGLQIETGANATPYIETDGGAASRLAIPRTSSMNHLQGNIH